MKERTKLLDINGLDLSRVKGHTKIILTNVNDGSQKIIEHENTFQSAVLAKYLRSLGVFNNSPWRNDTWASNEIWQNLVGGIFLFAEAIDNSQEDVEYMPAGNSMTGNGSYNVTNLAQPSELGSYNSVESVTTGNSSLTFVYDWGTSQGNGTISCVCLTTEIGGYVGYGNASGNRATVKDLRANQSSTNAVPPNNVIYKNNRLSFSVNQSEGKVTVTKTRFSVSQASLFQGKVKSTVEYSFSPLEITAAANGYFTSYIGGGKVVIMPSLVSISNGTTIKFLIFDLETNTFTQGTVNNTTGGWIETGFGSYNAHFAIDDDIVILPTRSSSTTTVQFPVFAFDLTTGDLVKTINGDGEDWGSNRPVASKLTDELLLLADTTIYDPIADTIKPCNGYCSSQAGSYYGYNDDIDAFVGAAAGESTGAYKNPLLLATINNLESPVVKDSTQTMKVIYTLTEA